MRNLHVSMHGGEYIDKDEVHLNSPVHVHTRVAVIRLPRTTCNLWSVPARHVRILTSSSRLLRICDAFFPTTIPQMSTTSPTTGACTTPVIISQVYEIMYLGTTLSYILRVLNCATRFTKTLEDMTKASIAFHLTSPCARNLGSTLIASIDSICRAAQRSQLPTLVMAKWMNRPSDAGTLKSLVFRLPI
jgi:hypothetical protein